jgi:hypothetical protein
MTLKYDQLADALAKLKFPEQGSDPVPYQNDGYMYSKDVAGVTELHYMNNNGAIGRLTDDGYTGPNHKTVSIKASVSDLLPDPPNGTLFTKLVGGQIELLYMNGSGAASLMTQDGYLASGVAHEDSLDASGGETYLNLTAPPRFAVGKASGRDLDVYRNGLLLKWAASPAGNSQWNYNAGAQRVEFGGSLGLSDWVIALYRSYA